MIRVSGIKLGLDDPIELLKKKLAKKLQIYETEILDYRIVKESIDARKDVQLVYTIDATLRYEDKVMGYAFVSTPKDETYVQPIPGVKSLKHRPVVIGFGPSGLFGALLLARMGYCPIVLERGSDVDARLSQVKHFWQTGELSELNNVQFGEGGAGTFSDGKLTTRVKDLRGRAILHELVQAGAPESILYEASPHIGTDLLSKVVKNIRNTIIECGGEVRFNQKVSDLKIVDDQITAIQVNEKEWIETDVCMVAIGHSARDTFTMLYERKLSMQQKPFAVGVRIEHPQTLINKMQYKAFASHPKLRAAEYKLTHTASTGRGVYTFCMCPGGVVVASASEEGHLVTNGMSYHARNGHNANSALVVQVDSKDFGSDHPLAGIEYQRKLEAKAYELGRGNYRAPAMLVDDFLNNRPSTEIKSVKPSYSLGVAMTDFNLLFNQEIVKSMQEALVAFDKKMPGFALKDAVLTGVESRTSSPIRIERSETFESNVKGIYPTGEGAGFAGGIMSASIDGMKVAEAIITTYSKK